MGVTYLFYQYAPAELRVSYKLLNVHWMIRESDGMDVPVVSIFPGSGAGVV